LSKGQCMKKSWIVFACMAIGCDMGSKSSNDLEVRTNKDEYFQESGIVVSMENKTDHTISVSVCENQSDIFYYRDRMTSTGWQEWTQLVCNSVLVPMNIPAGGLVTDTILVAKAGTYRFRIPFIHDQDSSMSGSAMSNEFSIYQ